MAHIRNISNGPRGAYLGTTLVMADPNEVIEADDFAEEWFEEVEEAEEAPADPLDHDGDGRKGGSLPKQPRKAAEAE